MNESSPMNESSGPIGDSRPPEEDLHTGQDRPPHEEVPAGDGQPLPEDLAAGQGRAPVSRPARTVTRARRRIDRSIRLLVIADLALVLGLVAVFGVALTGYLPTAGHPAQGSPS